MTKPAKRNSDHGIEGRQPPAPEVGGRHKPAHPASEGGGYPDICTPLRVGAHDPRVADFRRAGLPRIWVEIAELVGYEQFIGLWRILTDADEYHDNAGRVRLPSMGPYYRHLRNEWIRSLLAEGAEPVEIQCLMRRQMGHTLSISSIQRIGNDKR